MSHLPQRMLKIGGSLLDLPDLAARVENWLSAQPPARNLLMVGGGEPVDRLRQEFLGTQHDEVALHWQCVDWMDQNAACLAKLLPRFEVCDRLPPGDEKPRLAGWVFRMGDWLKLAEPLLPGTKLGTNWDVSSDSIAARVAVAWQADALILFKSKNPPSGDLVQLAKHGFVDTMFSEFQEEMPPWQFVNLRHSHVGL